MGRLHIMASFHWHLQRHHCSSTTAKVLEGGYQYRNIHMACETCSPLPPHNTTTSPSAGLTPTRHTSFSVWAPRVAWGGHSRSDPQPHRRTETNKKKFKFLVLFFFFFFFFVELFILFFSFLCHNERICFQSFRGSFQESPRIGAACCVSCGA